MKTGFLITGLILLLLANLMMVYASPFGVQANEGFQASPAQEGFQASPAQEGFTQQFLERAANSGMSGNAYEPIGAFDDIRVTPDHGRSSWRGPEPDVPLAGAAVQPGPDNLFYFKNNQVKPECCSSSYSSDMGCVCTTPQQRQYLNTRGGNRTVEDGI